MQNEWEEDEKGKNEKKKKTREKNNGKKRKFGQNQRDAEEKKVDLCLYKHSSLVCVT